MQPSQRSDRAFPPFGNLSDDLCILPFEFTLDVPLPFGTAPDQLAPVLRGHLSTAIRKSVCSTGASICSSPERICPKFTDCAYAYVFESSRPNDALRGSLPRPYALALFARGRQVVLQVALAGMSGNLIEMFLSELMKSFDRGVGTRRLRMDPVELRQPWGTASPLKLRPAQWGDFVGLDDEKKRRVRVSLVSPLRIKKWGRIQPDIERMEFAHLLDLVLSRYECLSSHFGKGDSGVRSNLLSQESDVRIVAKALRFVHKERYSTRHRRSLPLGGLQGTFDLVGDVGRFLPLLRLGQWLQIGKATTMGNGAYRLNLDQEEGAVI